jgi:hypothetical protein
MIRFLFSLASIVVLGVSLGYFLWGSQAGNLTQSLNNLVLEQDILRERLARAGIADLPTAGTPAAAVSANGQDQALPTDLTATLAALKEEVQFQAKLIEQQTELLTKLTEGGGDAGVDPAALENCRSGLSQANTQLQRCLVEKQALGAVPAAPGALVPDPVPAIPGAPPPVPGQAPGPAAMAPAANGLMGSAGSPATAPAAAPADPAQRPGWNDQAPAADRDYGDTDPRF